MVMHSIKNYKGIYSINEQGHVLAHKKKRADGRVFPEKTLKSHINNCGYESVLLTKKGKHKRVYVHRLVAQTFIPNPKKYKTVNHKNGVKADNNVENLEWMSYSQNVKHSFDVLGRKHWRTGVKGMVEGQNISGLMGEPWNKGMRKHKNIKCPCGKEFYPPKKTSKFCTKTCAMKGNKRAINYLIAEGIITTL